SRRLARSRLFARPYRSTRRSGRLRHGHGARHRGRRRAADRDGAWEPPARHRRRRQRAEHVMHALVDIGNTRIKWALYDGERLAQHGSAVHRGAVDAALRAFAAALPRELARVVVANVAGDALERALRAAVGSRAVDFVATSAERFGVRCAYAEPQRLGVDRWVAVLAAHSLAAGAACVIDAGTAVTFDAVAADGAHLGGLILPGARLLAAALDRNTNAIGATPV